MQLAKRQNRSGTRFLAVSSLLESFIEPAISLWRANRSDDGSAGPAASDAEPPKAPP